MWSTIQKNFFKVFSFFLAGILSLAGVSTPSKKDVIRYPASYTANEKSDKEMYDFTMGEYDLVVSQNANDNWSGKLALPNVADNDGPIKTIQQAKELLKKLKNEGVQENITVWIRGGTYYFPESLNFTGEDMPNVTFRAYPNEKVIFSGAKAISGWQTETVNGVTAWTTIVNVADGYFKSLYKGNKTLSRPIYPKSGYLYIESPDRANSLFNDDNKPWELTYGDRSFVAKKGDIGNISNLSDVCVRILHYWNDEISNAVSYDASTRILKFDTPSSMQIRKGDKYFLENVFEALNSPNEWYLNRQTGKLYYIPESTDDIDNTVLYAGTNERLVTINGVNGITFDNITFANNEWNKPIPTPGVMLAEYGMKFPQAEIDVNSAVYVANTEDVRFKDCAFENIANTALHFGVNVENSFVTGCYFDTIGANAIMIKGDNVPRDSEKITKGITVTDNHICNYGRRFYGAIGVLVIHASDNIISNNEIHDGYYTAISVGWIWGYGYSVTQNNQICDNLIYNIGQGWLSDMGGIYTLGIQNGTVISGNTIHNVEADPGQGGYGGWGIYLDEGSSNISVKNNLVYECGSQGFHQHYGENNLVTNNIFALNKEGQIQVNNRDINRSVYFKGNIVVGNNQPIFSSSSHAQFDESNLFWDYTRQSLIKSGSSEIIKAHGVLWMRGRGYYKDAIIADPLFKDTKNHDFALARNSPATDFGFETWNYLNAGTITKF